MNTMSINIHLSFIIKIKVNVCRIILSYCVWSDENSSPDTYWSFQLLEPWIFTFDTWVCSFNGYFHWLLWSLCDRLYPSVVWGLINVGDILAFLPIHLFGRFSRQVLIWWRPGLSSLRVLTNFGITLLFSSDHAPKCNRQIIEKNTFLSVHFPKLVSWRLIVDSKFHAVFLLL